MIANVLADNTVNIPDAIGRRLGIKPGDQLDWEPIEGTDAVLVRRITGRGELARRLCGVGAGLAPNRDLVAELDAERESEDRERFGALGQ